MRQMNTMSRKRFIWEELYTFDKRPLYGLRYHEVNSQLFHLMKLDYSLHHVHL